MFRTETVWAVLLAQALAVVVCPSETVLCRTSDGSVKVESAVNGTCSRQLHNVPGQRRSQGQASAFCSFKGLAHHGPCSDTLLSSSQDATRPQQLLPVPVRGEVEIIAASDDGIVVVVEHVVLVESTDPPWRQCDLDILRTVRLLV